MKQSFGAELSRIEGKIRESTSWPSPGTGLAFHILQLIDDAQPRWPSSVKISFPQGQLDTAPLIAAAGYSMCVATPNSDQFARWQSALHRFTKRDPFPRDRQTFAFRPSELVAIALGISKSNIGGSPTAAWIRSVIEMLPNKNPAQDVWASLLHHYAAALVGVSWPIKLPSRLADYELSELCLLFALLNKGRIPQPAEVENRRLAAAIVQRAVAITQDVREPEKLAALVAGISLALRGQLEDFNAVGSNVSPTTTKESEDSQQSSHNDASHPLVVLVHGIRTSGKWIRRIKPVLEGEGGCVVESAGFGFFDVFRFLLPGPTRKAVIETVKWKLLHAVDRHKERPLVIVAHSFGTFCITEILKDSPQIRPARLLFCGSIVAQNFRWDSLSQMAPDRGMRVVNECGARDIWPPLAHSVTFGYGSSGTGGFQVPGVEDRCHDLGHSGYFTKEFVRQFWVPFIRDGTIAHSKYEEEMPEAPWWLSVIGFRPLLPWLLWIFLALLGCAIVFGMAKRMRPVKIDPNDPIMLVQGKMSLAFNRILKPDEFAFQSEALDAISSPLDSQLILASFTIQQIRPFIPPPLTEPGKPGEKRWTQIDVTFDNSPGLLPSNLERYSTSSFTTKCDYLVYRGLRSPTDVTITGKLTLMFNGSKRLEFYIPTHYFNEGNDVAVFVPLNERARAQMDEYRMFNPSSGIRTTTLP